jgi:hypothetical protein
MSAMPAKGIVGTSQLIAHNPLPPPRMSHTTMVRILGNMNTWEISGLGEYNVISIQCFSFFFCIMDL